MSNSEQAGMGARIYPGGVAFRVWAPFAQDVYVTGAFDNWSQYTYPLSRDGESGYWSTNVPGAKAGQEYKFLLRNGVEFSRLDPYSTDLNQSACNSIVVNTAFDWGQSYFKMPPWNEIVIYELHIGTYNVRRAGLPGRFDDVVVKLPYLRDLGINAIEVMPVTQFPGNFSFGYNPAHLFAVANAYGNSIAFKRFIKAAHEHEIGVILDVVYSHAGPNKLTLWRFDGWHHNGFGGIYFYADWRAQTPWGDKNRLNYDCEDVVAFLRDNVLTWLEQYRLDGLRFDATNYIRNVHGWNNHPPGDIPAGWHLMQRLNAEVSARQPWKIMIAEDLQSNELLTQATEAGGAGFGSQWDTDFVHPVRKALVSCHDEGRDMNRVRDAICHRYGRDAFKRVIYTESHDQERLPTEIWYGNSGSYFSKKRSTLGAVLVFTSPGIPMIFQGQEFLEDGYVMPDIPLDWDKSDRFGGICNLYRDLIRLRRNWFDTTRGLSGQRVNVFHLNTGDKVIAFHRWAEGGVGDDVVIIINFANRSYESYVIGFPREGIWKLRFNSDWSGYSLDFGTLPCYDAVAIRGEMDGMAFNGSIGLGRYTALIFSQ